MTKSYNPNTGEAKDDTQAKVRALRWLKGVAYEEVVLFQEERVGRTSYGRFNKTCRRMIRQTVINRVLDDEKARHRYGFIGVGWLLSVVIGAVISWAIQRWLDRVIPPKPVIVGSKK
jgi:hypothetical protein